MLRPRDGWIPEKKKGKKSFLRAFLLISFIIHLGLELSLHLFALSALNFSLFLSRFFAAGAFCARRRNKKKLWAEERAKGGRDSARIRKKEQRVRWGYLFIHTLILSPFFHSFFPPSHLLFNSFLLFPSRKR